MWCSKFNKLNAPITGQQQREYKMAEIKRHDKTEVFDTSAMPVTITLTGREAVTLLTVISFVGGDRSDSPRRYMSEIHDALVSVEGLAAEMNRLDLKAEGDIYFK